ncbi:hypothetical protein HDV06_000084 [Boothiomyces sp. JEL0866]|nr:hypothetical protein HDV06_000084 [Boothiomyces sp. JEL0866]
MENSCVEPTTKHSGMQSIENSNYLEHAGRNRSKIQPFNSELERVDVPQRNLVEKHHAPTRILPGILFQEKQIQNVLPLAMFIICSIMYFGSSLYLVSVLIADGKHKHFTNPFFNYQVVVGPSVGALFGALLTFWFVCLVPLITLYVSILAVIAELSISIYLLCKANLTGFYAILIVILIIFVVASVSALVGFKKQLFAKLIRFTTDFKNKNPAIYLLCFLNFIVQVGFTCYWTLSMVALNHYSLKKEIGSTNLFLVLYVFYGFMYYWLGQIVSNFQRVLLCNIFVLGLFNKVNANSVLRTFNDIGQIVFGSLILVFSEFTSLVAGHAPSKKLKHISRLAFTHVVLYSTPFLESAKSSFLYAEDKGLGELYSYGSDSAYFFLINLFIGSATSFLSVYAYSKTFDYGGAYYAVAIVAFFVGVTISGCVSASISALNTCTLVCYSELGNEFSSAYPEFYKFLFEKFPIQ